MLDLPSAADMMHGSAGDCTTTRKTIVFLVVAELAAPGRRERQRTRCDNHRKVYDPSASFLTPCKPMTGRRNLPVSFNVSRRRALQARLTQSGLRRE